MGAKKRKRSKKSSKKKERVSLVWILSVIVLAVIISVLLLPKKPNAEIVVEGSSTYILNHAGLAAECHVDNEIVGILAPGEKREIESAGELSCIFRDYDPTGCEDTYFVICDAKREDSKLQQCAEKEGFYQLFCTAMLSHDISFCEHIKKEPERLHCLAYNSKDASFCEQSPLRDGCYMDLGTNWNNEELCQKIMDEGMKNECLAVTSYDPDLCKGSDACIMRIAGLKHDSSLCDLVEDRESCLAGIY